MDIKMNYEANKRKDYDPIVTAHTELTDNLNDDLIRFQDEAYELGYKRGVFSFSDAFKLLEKAYRYQKVARILRRQDHYMDETDAYRKAELAVAMKATEYENKAQALFEQARATHGG